MRARDSNPRPPLSQKSDVRLGPNMPQTWARKRLETCRKVNSAYQVLQMNFIIKDHSHQTYRRHGLCDKLVATRN